jgi:hypothetical protein
VNDNRPASYKMNGLKNSIKPLQRNSTNYWLIMLAFVERLSVACLHLNLEMWDQWKDKTDTVVDDCMRFLDNVMSHFIALTDGVDGFERANYSAKWSVVSD